MTAFLKIDECERCKRALPWEFIPAVKVNGKPLPGTGVWRSELDEGICLSCRSDREAKRLQEQEATEARTALIQLLGGPLPYRDFTFDRFQVTPLNRLAFERAREFSPALDNLYLWGPCGVGKTHLALAIARRCFEESVSVAVLLAAQLSRKIRMKEPFQEQEAINGLASFEALILDDLG
ncbi:MAG TPA: ATP-binding protein, partial [Bryobacteraceae bacterium]|nr:ATP-binding protein [Bryobacteraceae bacterium]